MNMESIEGFLVNSIDALLLILVVLALVTAIIYGAGFSIDIIYNETIKSISDIKKKKKDKSHCERIVAKERSNVIQYDQMGYPLRLIINQDNEQVWIDTYEQEDDVVLKWEESQ